MWKFIKRIIFIVIVFNILAVIWDDFFNPPITFIQLGGLAEYGKLDRDYISFDEMGDNVKLCCNSQ